MLHNSLSLNVCHGDYFCTVYQFPVTNLTIKGWEKGGGLFVGWVTHSDFLSATSNYLLANFITS